MNPSVVTVAIPGIACTCPALDIAAEVPADALAPTVNATGATLLAGNACM
jgi:hypothetical protein